MPRERGGALRSCGDLHAPTATGGSVVGDGGGLHGRCRRSACNHATVDVATRARRAPSCAAPQRRGAGVASRGCGAPGDERRQPPSSPPRVGRVVDSAARWRRLLPRSRCRWAVSRQPARGGTNAGRWRRVLTARRRSTRAVAARRALGCPRRRYAPLRRRTSARWTGWGRRRRQKPPPAPAASCCSRRRRTQHLQPQPQQPSAATARLCSCSGTRQPEQRCARDALRRA